MGWGIALAVVLAIGLLPLGISIVYEASGFRMTILAGPVKFPVKLEKKQKESEKGKKDTSKVPSEKKSTKKPEPKQGGNFTDFLPLLQVLKELLGDLRRRLRVKKLEMKLTMAGDDTCDLAVNYGRAWAAVGNIMPMLEQLCFIKKRDVQVACDFVGTQTTLYLRVDAVMALWRLLGMLLRHGFRGIREYLKINEKRKGGAVK